MKTRKTEKLNSLKTILLATGVVFALRLASAQCDPPPSGIVAWWPGEGNAKDIVGGNNGVIYGSTHFGQGEVGSAFVLNGTGDYINVGNPTTLRFGGTTPFSIEGWISPTTLGTTIISKYNFGVEGEWQVAINTNGVLSFHREHGPYKLYGQQVLPLGQFSHFAATYDGTWMKIFVNGQLDTQTDQIGYSASANNTSVIIGNSFNHSSLGTNNTFAGEIDELSIYNRALSASEIASIYASGSVGKCRSPFITSQPQNQIGYWGQSAAFSVVALPPPLNYQWRSNGVAIFGATNQTLTLTNLQNSFAAGYTVVVTNSYGSVTSAPPANLTINPAGVAIALYPGVKIDGVVGLTYGIQSTTNLANTNSWIGVTNLTFTQPTEIWYDAIPASLAQRFYRVLQGPIPIP
jgi:hypothetical protein